MSSIKLKLIDKNKEHFLWNPSASSIYKIEESIFQALKSEKGLLKLPPDISQDEKIILNNFIGNFNLPVIKALTDVKTMILHSTWKCNLNCKYCYLDIDEIEKKEMPLENMLSAIKQFSDVGGLFLDISGGEPLTREDLPAIVKKGHDLALRVTIVTNGTLLNPKKIEDIKDYIHQISISMDGINESHNYLRGEGTFEKMIYSLNLLKDYSIPTGVTTVVTNSNSNQLLELHNLLSSYNVKQWNLTLLRSTGRAIKTGVKGSKIFLDDFLEKVSEDKNMEIVVDESLLSPKLRSALTDIYKKEDYARWHNTLTVLPNGDCVACVFFPKIVYGNIIKNSIPEIYESPIRKEVLSLKKPCDTCPLALED